MEQKVDQMAAELTGRLLNREDTALQYKRCGLDMYCNTAVSRTLCTRLPLVLGAVHWNRDLTRW